MMLILKASKIALLAAFELLPCFKKNCLQKRLQLSLAVLSFKNKSLWIKRDHFLVLLVFVVTHSSLGRLGEGNAHCGGGWDEMLVCWERDDTDLEGERSAVTTYSISCASPRHGVCAGWKLGCWSWFPAMRKTANCTPQPKATLCQVGFKDLLVEGLCQYLQITERCFGSFDIQNTVAQWWTGRVNGGSAQNTKRQSLCPLKELGSTAELVFVNGNAIHSPRL